MIADLVAALICAASYELMARLDHRERSHRGGHAGGQRKQRKRMRGRALYARAVRVVDAFEGQS